MTDLSLIRKEAVSLTRESIEPDARVLVLGATGWFGRTAVALLLGAGIKNLHLVASKTSILGSGSSKLPVYGWNRLDINKFQPTWVLNFAFLTGEKWSATDSALYIDTNRSLTERFRAAASMASVTRAVTVSSGAALYGAKNPYGLLKLEEERVARQLQDSKRHTLILRAWSLSGALVTRPQDYLFSNLILQSFRGDIEINSPRRVFRRYIGVDDFLAVGLSQMRSNDHLEMDSGGQAVEAAELAELIGNPLHRKVIRKTLDENSAPDSYHSDGEQWSSLMRQTNYREASLQEQVDVVREHLSRAFTD